MDHQVDLIRGQKKLRALRERQATSGLARRAGKHARNCRRINAIGLETAGFRYEWNFFQPPFNVYVGVDPAVQPSFVGKTADVYIVDDQMDAQWTVDKTLNDKTGFVEKITVNGVCGNCWRTLAWSAPLTVGKYDVVLDFNQDGKYTPGVDLIDSLDPVGFTVSEVRVDTISFNYTGSGAIQCTTKARPPTSLRRNTLRRAT